MLHPRVRRPSLTELIIPASRSKSEGFRPQVAENSRTTRDPAYFSHFCFLRSVPGSRCTSSSSRVSGDSVEIWLGSSRLAVQDGPSWRSMGFSSVNHAPSQNFIKQDASQAAQVSSAASVWAPSHSSSQEASRVYDILGAPQSTVVAAQHKRACKTGRTNGRHWQQRLPSSPRCWRDRSASP